MQPARSALSLSPLSALLEFIIFYFLEVLLVVFAIVVLRGT